MQNTNNIFHLPIWFKSPLSQFFIRNFSCTSSSLLPKRKRQASATPEKSDDLDTKLKFEEEISKAGFPDGIEGAPKLYDIVGKLSEERSQKIEQFRNELDQDRKEDIQEAEESYGSKNITIRQRDMVINKINDTHQERIKDHEKACEKEWKQYLDAVSDYKKDNNMPEMDTSHIDSSTEMPGPWDDE